LLSDCSIAKYLQGNRKERKERLAKSVKQAIEDGLQVESVERCLPDKLAADAVKTFDGKPLLVVDKERKDVLLGIVTAFDLL